VRREGLWKWGLRVVGLREKEQPKGKGWGVAACLERETRFSCLGERPDRWSGERQQKKKPKARGGATGKKKNRFRVFFFVVPKFTNYPLLTFESHYL